jgi:hypothetical protein
MISVFSLAAATLFGFAIGFFVGVLAHAVSVAGDMKELDRYRSRSILPFVPTRRTDHDRRTTLHIVAMVIVGLTWSGCSSPAVTRVDVRERGDSLFVRGDTVRIINVASDTVYVDRIDTTIISLNPSAVRDTIRIVGFRRVLADLDTTVSGVTIFAEYEYPPDRWRVDVMERDTVIKWTVRDSIIERPYAVTEVPFWVYLTLVGMALALVAMIIKR